MAEKSFVNSCVPWNNLRILKLVVVPLTQYKAVVIATESKPFGITNALINHFLGFRLYTTRLCSRTLLYSVESRYYIFIVYLFSEPVPPVFSLF